MADRPGFVGDARVEEERPRAAVLDELELGARVAVAMDGFAGLAERVEAADPLDDGGPRAEDGPGRRVLVLVLGTRWWPGVGREAGAGRWGGGAVSRSKP